MTRRATGLSIVGAGLAVITAIVGLSLDRRMYFFYRFQDEAKWEYPTGGVLLVVVACVIETAILFCAIVPVRPGRVWSRALAGLVVMIPWALVASEVVIHAPGFWLAHILWVWCVVASLAIACLVSGSVHAYSRLVRTGDQAPRLVE
jgi:hypothetical protein